MVINYGFLNQCPRTAAPVVPPHSPDQCAGEVVRQASSGPGTSLQWWPGDGWTRCQAAAPSTHSALTLGSVSERFSDKLCTEIRRDKDYTEERFLRDIR